MPTLYASTDKIEERQRPEPVGAESKVKDIPGSCAIRRGFQMEILRTDSEGEQRTSENGVQEGKPQHVSKTNFLVGDKNGKKPTLIRFLAK